MAPLGVAAPWMAHLGADRLAPSVGDHRVARHGPVFAARTAVEFAALGVAPQGFLIRLRDVGSLRTADLTRPALPPVRAALADAPDELYAQAVAARRPEQRLRDIWIATSAASRCSEERTVPFSTVDTEST